MYKTWLGRSAICNFSFLISFAARGTGRSFVNLATFHTQNVVLKRRIFARRARDREANRADIFPAALKLWREVLGKPRNSTSQADALSRDRSVRGTVECSVDNEYLAPDAQQ